jgi:hypothetical protein
MSLAAVAAAPPTAYRRANVPDDPCARVRVQKICLSATKSNKLRRARERESILSLMRQKEHKVSVGGMAKRKEKVAEGKLFFAPLALVF